MTKPNGVVTWKAFALFVVVGGAVLAGCWGYALGAKAQGHDNAVEIAVTKAQTQGFKDDLRDFRAEQRRWNQSQDAKVDRILERLP